MIPNNYITLPTVIGRQWIEESWTIYKSKALAFSGYYLFSVIVSLGLSQLGIWGVVLAFVFDTLISLIFLFYIREVTRKSQRSFLSCAHQVYDCLPRTIIFYFYLCAINTFFIAVCAMVSFSFGFHAILEFFETGEFDFSRILVSLTLFVPLTAGFLATISMFLRTARPSVVFDKLSTRESINLSVQATWANFSPLLVYYSYLSLLIFVCFITLGLGIFVIMPVYMIGEYIIWRDMIGVDPTPPTEPMVEETSDRESLQSS